MRRKLAAGNWKMNGLSASVSEVTALTSTHVAPKVDVLLCPPATLISGLATAAAGHPLAIGGQDCHTAMSGAHTGDISAEQLRDAGATAVLVGHSERRTDHSEDDAQIRQKAEAAQAAALTAVICIGETLSQRDNGATLDVVKTQLDGSTPDNATGANTVIAYEPVWAIGTGKVPTLDQIGEVHSFIRAELVARFCEEGHAIRILYGGSVKPANAADIFGVEDVDGALVGGASLKAADFSPIITALENA